MQTKTGARRIVIVYGVNVIFLNIPWLLWKLEAEVGAMDHLVQRSYPFYNRFTTAPS
jgi:hypothetical protein